MFKFIITGLLTLSSSSVYALPACSKWIHESTFEEQITSSISFERVAYYCSKFGVEPGANSLQEAKQLGWDSEYVKIFKHIGPFKYQLETVGPLPDTEGPAAKINIVDIPDKDPSTFAIIESHFSASNIWIRLEAKKASLFGSTTTDSLTKPLNKYQSTNRQGSEWDIEGFYSSDTGDLLINVLIDDEGNSSRCNACRIYHVATMEYKDGLFSEVSRSMYDINTYASPNGITANIKGD